MSLVQSKLVIIITSSTFDMNENLYSIQKLHIDRGCGEFENSILMNIVCYNIDRILRAL